MQKGDVGVQKKIGSLFVFFLFVAFTFAQDIKLTASVDNAQIRLNDNIVYTIKVEGLRQIPFRLPAIPNFRLLNPNPSTNHNMSMVNGKITQSISYSYYLKPEKLGKLVIPSLNVKIKNKNYTINSVTVTVLKDDSKLNGADAFLKTVVSTTKPYVNQEVTVQTVLYVRNGIRLAQVRLKKMPTITGVWKESYDMENIEQLDAKIIKDVSYNTYLLSKDALFPTKAGKLKIESAEISAFVQRRRKQQRRSIFNDPFNTLRGSSVDELVVKAPERFITVRKPAAADDLYSGFVGHLRVRAKLDKQTFETNDGFKLTLTLSGTGNIQTIEQPKFYISPDIEQYDPTVRSTVNKDGAKISGRKIIEYVLVPRVAGEQKIGPIELSYFNTAKGKLEHIHIDEFVLDVKEGKSFSAAATNGLSAVTKKSLKTLDEDIRYIMDESPSFNAKNTHMAQSIVYFLAYPVVLLLFLLASFFMKRRQYLSQNSHLQRKRSASSKASKFLKQAKALRESGDSAAFFPSIAQSITQFIADKTGTNAAGFTREQLSDLLESYRVPASLTEQVHSCLESCDFYRFSNPTDPTVEMQKIYDEADALLSQLMKVIK
jgi:hypothetical protein